MSINFCSLGMIVTRQTSKCDKIVRLKDLCKIELRNMNKTSDMPVPRSPPFQSKTTGFRMK